MREKEEKEREDKKEKKKERERKENKITIDHRSQKGTKKRIRDKREKR